MHTNQSATYNRLQRLFDKTVLKLPGKQLISSIQSGDGSLNWSAASGVTISGHEATAETPYFIASIDKLINAALLLQLVEQGSVNLNTSISKYLPSTTVSKLHVLKGRDYTPQITVLNLLQHTSGLADWYEDYPSKGKSLVDDIISNGDRDLPLDEILTYVREKLTPNFPPHSESSDKVKTRYSDTNFMLICAIIESVTGKSLEQLHHDKIYGPLQMNQTWLWNRTEPEVPVGSHLPLKASGALLEIPKLIRSVWGVYSTSSDQIKLLKGLYTGIVFKREETARMMFSNWNTFGFPTDKAAIRLPGWPIAYGMGSMHFKLPKLFTLGRDVPFVIGHTGSTGCWLFYAPDVDLYLTGAAEDVTAGALPFRYIPAILKTLSA